MGVSAKVCGFAAVVAVSAALPAHAEELALTCALRSLEDPSDATLYPVKVRIDLDQRRVLDFEGDGGAGWVIDAFTDTRIEAHFDFPDEIGGIIIDRAAGTLDMISAIRGVIPRVLEWRGACLPTLR